MPEEIKKELSLLIKVEKYKKGDILYKQGEDSTEMYIMNKGKVAVYIDDICIAIINKEGSILGESSALFNQKRSATIKVLDESEFIVVPGEYVDKVILENPSIGLNLVRTIADRLHDASQQIVHLQKKIIEYENEIARLKGKSIEREFKLGEMFYKTGMITREQLEEVINKQKEYSDKGIKKSIGEILVEKGYATMFQVMQMVKLQKLLEDEYK